VIPANTGGISANGFQIWVNGLLTATTMSSARAYNLTGLTPGDIATVQVKVCNTAGCSPASTTRNVTTAPPAPGSLSSNPAQESIEIFWTDADAPVITGHRIYYRLTGAPSWTLHETRLTSEASVPEIVFNGLTAKTSYQFKVVAYNVTGEASTTVHTVETLSYQLPGAPTGVLAAPGNGALSVSWTAPTDRGGDSGALYFYATASIGAIVHGSCSATEPSTGCEITGLTNGTEYVVRVTAANDAGTGAASESNLSSIATPRTVPSQITDLAGSSGDEQVTLTWSAPADGGAPIVSYRIEYHDGDGVWELHGNPSSANVVIDGSASYVVNALTNGTTYSFRISAVNDAGWGTVSGTYTTTPTGGETPAQTTAASLWNEIVNRNSIVYDEKVAFVYRPNGCITTAWYGSSWSASESESDCTNSGGTWYPAAAVMVVDGPDADTYVSSYPTAYLAGGTEVATALDPGSQTPEEFATDVRVALAAHALANGAQQINFNNGNVYFLSASGDYNSYTNDGLTDYSITMAYEPLYDMYKAGKPETPSGVTVDTSDGVTVSWTQATGTGQVAGGMYSQIWGYQVTASPGGGTCSTSANSTSCKVNGLTPGETYTFTVKTGAYGGYSDPSTPTGAIVAPAAVAATAPREISIYSAGWTETGSVQMYWSAPLWDGGSAVTDYVIEYSDDNGDSWTTANDGVSTDANKVLGGFTPGNTYKFRLRAVTSVGNGAASSPITVTIFRPIEAPTSVTATPADGSVTVSWTAPSYGTPVNYNVQYSSDGGSSWTTFSDNWDANTTTTVTGLTNGTEYLFRVNAVDNESTSAWSTPSLAVAPVFSWPNGTPQVGDTGPGGGKVFYVSETPFACGANLASTCTYLEAAPIAGWYLQGYMVRSWSSNTSTDVSGADGTAIGTGYQNSVDIANQSGNTHLNSAAVKARAYTSNGFSDWFLPSKDELNQLYLQRATVGYAEAMYWSSSEVNATTAWTQEVGGNGNQMSWYNKYQTYVAHPVRAG
jgi:titin